MRRLAAHLIRTAAFGAFGVFCTIGVATILGFAHSDRFDRERERSGTSQGPFEERSNDYWRWLILEYRTSRGLEIHSTWLGADQSGGVFGGWPDEPAGPLVPSWGQFVSPIGNTARDAGHAALAVSRGWPLPAFGGGFLIRWRSGPVPEVTTHTGVLLDPIPDGDFNSWQDARVIPLRPLPLGFLVDTAIYSIAAWAAFTIPWTVRRAIRRRRGLCPHCGHALVGMSRCPECGIAGSGIERSDGTA